ncbi:MAG: HAD family hydrolase [Deltaproteobacteria bacterium]|nr:HAD family hydrolase [Deltaproteobacteria bacterium]
MRVDSNAMRIKGVLFDFDGTLTRPGALDFPAIKRILGCPPEHPILEFIASAPAHRQSELMKLLEEQEDLASKSSLPNRGAESCLLALKERLFPMGIHTRSRLKPIRMALERFEGVSIEDFRTVVTRETTRPKPHPEGVIRAAAEMGISCCQLLVVGDFSFDVIAGKRAGAMTAFLTNGGACVMAPENPAPDYIIGNLEELPDLLNRGFG